MHDQAVILSSSPEQCVERVSSCQGDSLGVCGQSGQKPFKVKYDLGAGGRDEGRERTVLSDPSGGKGECQRRFVCSKRKDGVSLVDTGRQEHAPGGVQWSLLWIITPTHSGVDKAIRTKAIRHHAGVSSCI